MNNADRQGQFSPSGFFVLRTPLLPFDEFLHWSDGLEPLTSEDSARSDGAYARNCAILRERLRAAITRPELREALFIASPNIQERFHLWQETPDSERGRKVEHVLVRYFSRMTGRATPFGLFAGYSLGEFARQTRLEIEGRDRYRRSTRLDMDYLYALTDAITREPALRSGLIFRPNSSVYRVAGRLRYVESRLNEKRRSYHLVSVEETDYLLATLERAGEGATPAALAAALVEGDVSLAEARDYVAQLIESQILVPNIALNVSGSESIHPLIEQLREHSETKAMAGTLDHARAKLESIDSDGLGVDAEHYTSIKRALETLPAKIELSRLFQVDLRKPAPEATLGGEVLDEIRHGIDVLHHLSPRPKEDALKHFRERFVARYEEREVPLVEALDEEIGIGYGRSEETSPLLSDLAFPAQPEDSFVHNGRRYEFLLRKVGEALQSGAQRITLTAEEIETISDKDPPPLPDAFAVGARLAASSQTALDNGEFQLFIESITGPSGAALLGRFCQADDVLHQQVLSHLRAEESFQPEAIFAEIVHLPEGRVGNVIARPVLRDYEIPYLGRSGASIDEQLPLTDLQVSVRQGRIRLRSARLNREVLPRLTNAHNYDWKGLGVYKFLCMLSQQGVAGWSSWDWGALAVAPFLPRATTGRLVLALARWRATKDELATLGKQKGAFRYRATQDWHKVRGLPRFAALADADNLLVIDFENPLSVESFIQLVKEREGATLVELFPPADQLCARGPEGAFTHELIVPFVKEQNSEISSQKGEADTRRPTLSSYPCCPVSPAVRRFPPGSEWLYCKIYTGTATADALLRERVIPLTESLLKSQAADCWFFVRYGDPDWHVRLRFHGLPERLQQEVLPALQATFKSLHDDGRLWRVQFETYEQEVERYGGASGITLAERLFYADSESALEIIEMLEPGDEGLDERWRLTLYGIDRLLDDFGFDLSGKYSVIKRAREGLVTEFHVDKRLLGELSDKFRQERRNLAALLATAPTDEHPLAAGIAALRRRSARLAPIVIELKILEETARLAVPIAELLLSYIHMHANRLLRSAQRQQELVIYDLLARLYQSQIARTQ